MTEKVNGYTLDMDFLPQDVLDKLNEELDPSLIKSYEGPGKKTLYYIEAHAAISNANRIFKPANWGPRVLEGPTLHQVQITDRQTGQITAVHEYYTALVAVYVYGRFISSDEGFGEVDEIHENTQTKMMLGMHEKARKGAISDGIKRALRILGKQFGNSLYGDGETGRESSAYASGPACPTHGAGRHIKESQWGDGFFCAMKDGSTESGYCDRTPIDPDSVPLTRETAAYAAPANNRPGGNQPGEQDVPNTWPYAAQDRSGNAPAPSPTPAPVHAGAVATQVSSGKSVEELMDIYVSLGEERGMNKGQIFTLFMRQHRKPISQATVEELEALIASAQQSS